MRKLVTAMTIGLLLAAGCDSDHHHDHGEAHAAVCESSLTHDQYDESKVAEQPGAEIGDLTRCPISGSVFRITESSPSAVQKGETYYTCCGGCVDQLEQSFARRR